MPSTSHPMAVVAAAASAAAGAIHAAAAGSHADMTTLSRLFAVAAVAQIGWATVVLWRHHRVTVLAGIAINLGALGFWGVSRSVGIGAVEGLEAGQPVGFQDGLAAALAVLAALAAAASLSTTVAPRLLRASVPAIVGVIAVAAVPAMATPHAHDHGGHGHAEEIAAGPDDSHDHGDGHEHDENHDHGGDDGTTGAAPGEVAAPATDEELGYPSSFTTWLDQAPDPAARDRAEELIVATHEAMEAFPDEAAVQAAGFISIGDGATGWEHYINVQRIVDPRVLDPEDIESIVLKVHPDGTKEVASAMYLLPFGTTMADAPDIAGDLTPWHDHQDLCWEGARVVGHVDAQGNCARGVFRATQPMLHVWVTEHPCGPFAGIEGEHGSGCDHDHAEAPAAEEHGHEPGAEPHDH